jgi:hypothetical protein
MTARKFAVMAGLVPAIHALLPRNDAYLRNVSIHCRQSDRVDARDKRGHDGLEKGRLA